MKRKAFVLLSGGMDSTTCLHTAIADFLPKELSYNITGEEYLSDKTWAPGSAPDVDWVEAVSIFYNQRHAKELEFAAQTCKMFGIKHTILDVGNLLAGTNVLLSADSLGKMDMVHMSYDDIKGVSPSYVPFRNGLLLSAITAHAQKYVNSEIEEFAKVLGPKGAGITFDPQEARDSATKEARDLVTIYYGAHAEDAANWAYPDCTPEFNGSMANAIYTGSYNTIRLATPLQWMKKSEIVQKGELLSVKWQNTWSCYDNGNFHCGKCPTCLARKTAFKNAGVEDPTKYGE